MIAVPLISDFQALTARTIGRLLAVLEMESDPDFRMSKEAAIERMNEIAAISTTEPFHMFRYLDEQCFRYNNRKDGKRKLTDKERFDLALAGVTGKRLTYADLTAKGADHSEAPF